MHHRPATHSRTNPTTCPLLPGGAINHRHRKIRAQKYNLKVTFRRTGLSLALALGFSTWSAVPASEKGSAPRDDVARVVGRLASNPCLTPTMVCQSIQQNWWLIALFLPCPVAKTIQNHPSSYAAVWLVKGWVVTWPVIQTSKFQCLEWSVPDVSQKLVGERRG